MLDGCLSFISIDQIRMGAPDSPKRTEANVTFVEASNNLDARQITNHKIERWEIFTDWPYHCADKLSSDMFICFHLIDLRSMLYLRFTRAHTIRIRCHRTAGSHSSWIIIHNNKFACESNAKRETKKVNKHDDRTRERPSDSREYM